MSSNIPAPVIFNLFNKLRKSDKLLDKPLIYHFNWTNLVNTIICEHSCNIFFSCLMPHLQGLTEVILKVRNTARIGNGYNQVPHLSHDTKWENKKTAINITNKSQEVSPFLWGNHKAAINRRESMTNTRHKLHKWSTKEHIFDVLWLFLHTFYMLPIPCNQTDKLPHAL